MSDKDPATERAYRRNREWYQRNIEQQRERGRIKSRAARLADPEKVRAQKLQSYYKHHSKNLEKGRRSRAKNPHANYANLRQWRMTNHGLMAGQRQRRRARKKNAPLIDLTHAQWLAIQEAQGHRCAYCGKRAKGHLSQDHITPLYKGGSHTLHNVIGACRACNSKKHIGPPLKPVQPLLL